VDRAAYAVGASSVDVFYGEPVGMSSDDDRIAALSDAQIGFARPSG